MPLRLPAPVLAVDAAKMHKVDTSNVENLFGMWTVFSKCADSMEEGRRLENLSWRLWNRETFCCAPRHEGHEDTLPVPVNGERSRRRESDAIPELSGSVDSAPSDDGDNIEGQAKAISAPLDIVRPTILSQDSDTRSRGKEKHITSLDLEKMVMTITEKKDLEPLSQKSRMPSAPKPTETLPRSSSPRPTTRSSSSAVAIDSAESVNADSPATGSDTSATTDLSSHSIVRGFSPGHISSSYRSQPYFSPPQMASKSPSPPKPEPQKKKGGMFIFGGSSGEEESSLDDHMARKQSRSSFANGLKKSLGNKKQTSFKDEVSTRTINEQPPDVFEESDDEDDGVSESAIDDEDDESDWEDSATESGRSSVEDKQMFQRVDSRPNLTSRRSLLTNLLHQPQRAAALANAASRSTPAMGRSRTTSPNGPSIATSPEEEPTLTMRSPEVPRSKPIIMTTSNTHQPSQLSPRTTRRNMLATELTESLRRHLLWERQQKSTTANAVLKRRHTAHDVANLQEYPGQKPPMMSKDASKNNSWNHYFDHGLGEYHQRGW
ncbi:MAG: hypothetical protein M1819_001783 [Sarea resinae]|nr:MAG: hypothetical protein M1819_001783 [Sarea resinae]